MNSNTAWKQLNDGLNHLFPVQNKKSSLPKNHPVGTVSQILRPPSLRKSSSRSSLYDGDLDFDPSNEDLDQRYHTVTGTTPNRKNTLVNLPGAMQHPGMQARNPLPSEAGLAMMVRRRNVSEVDEDQRLQSTSPYPWTAPDSRPVMVNGVSLREPMILSCNLKLSGCNVHRPTKR